MVFDWFKRNLQPRPAETDPAKEEVSALEAPKEPETGTELLGTAVPEVESTPAPAQPPAVEPAPADPEDALAWARQAYARLKAQQQAQTVGPEPQASSQGPEADGAAPASEESLQSPEVSSAPAVPAAPSLLEQAAARRTERQEALTAPAAQSAAEQPGPAIADSTTPPAPTGDEPQLGAFDDSFTWSAEVLAAQGRQLDEISLEEIDWLGRLRQGLEKTRRGFVTQLLDNLGDDPLTPEVLDDLETTLLRADVGVSATDQVLEALRQRLNQEVVDPTEGIRFLKEQLRGILDGPIRSSGVPLLAPQKGRLNVWLMVGVNGVGKTTTLGKLANLAVRSGYSCLIAAADTFRAAAVQQVQVWGERSGVPVIANPSANADPAAVVYDAIGAAQAHGTELVLVDTAGRLQTKHNLMEELAKVRRIVDKLAPDAAVESLLVLDASQGQNGLRQAMAFASAAGLTGVVVTKLDGSARGGVALAVASEAGLPIRFIGAGEGIRDLRPFNSFEFVEALLAS
jgi:fused signal recognition particle receptor